MTAARLGGGAGPEPGAEGGDGGRPLVQAARVLAVDIGAGTSDILLTEPGEPVENAVKLVVPSRTRVVGAQIGAATTAGRTVVFRGPVMGGGSSTSAMKAHLRAGHQFVATDEAALTFSDDLERVRSLGVRVVGEAAAAELLARLPAGSSVEVRSGDFDGAALRKALEQLGVETSFDAVLLAAQDHGFSPGGSNRAFRFGLWRAAVEESRAFQDLFWWEHQVPAGLTRLRAAAAAGRALAGDRPVLVGDTGPAALYGALPEDAGDGVIVNVGNSHTICVVARDGRLAGVFEHHTRMLDGAGLEDLLRRFLTGRLEDDEVRANGGHGAVMGEEATLDPDAVELIVTGPRRELLLDARLAVVFAAPRGDMMLTGCFGLLRAFEERLPPSVS